MAKQGFKILDSDMHIMEPPDLWERYIEDKYKARAPRGVQSQSLPACSCCSARLSLPALQHGARRVTRNIIPVWRSRRARGRRSQGAEAPAGPVARHPAAMREADDAAMDEPLRHRRGGDAACLHRRRRRGDDADRRHSFFRGAARVAGADVSLPADVVLHLLLPDRARHRRARTALPSAVIRCHDQAQ